MTGTYNYIVPETDDPAGPKEIEALADLMDSMLLSGNDRDIPRIIGPRLRAWLERQSKKISEEN